MFVYFRPLSDVRTGEVTTWNWTTSLSKSEQETASAPVGKLGNVTTAAADITKSP
jgi:hypothetical protein